jgi:hypothetical protein
MVIRIFERRSGRVGGVLMPQNYLLSVPCGKSGFPAPDRCTRQFRRFEPRMIHPFHLYPDLNSARGTKLRRTTPATAWHAACLILIVTVCVPSSFAGIEKPAAPGAALRATSSTELLARVESGLESGETELADSLFALATKSSIDPKLRHRREILSARLAAGRGDWNAAEARLRTWENTSARTTGSGEILFWRGWAALHQSRTMEADSLFVLASSYVEESRAQAALDYRFAALLETSPALLDYLRGLPESPLPGGLRAASLSRVPRESRLFPLSQWHLALLRESQGDTLGSIEILTGLAKDLGSMAGKRAGAVLAYLSEKSAPGSALHAYEALLVKTQQGAIAEFSRYRVQGLRKLGVNSRAEQVGP